MGTKIKPIKPILKEIKKLSKNPKDNKDELEDLRKIVLDQKKVIDSIDIDKIEKLINSKKTSEENKEKYLELKAEYYDYKKNTRIIKQIRSRNYRAIKEERTLKMKKMAVGISAAALAGVLAACLIFKPKKVSTRDDEYKTTAATTEVTTEAPETTETETTAFTTTTTTETTTEKKTEPTTEKKTEATSTETTTEKQTETTEVTTEKQTEATTEKQTETTETTTEKQTEATETTTEATTEKQLDDNAAQSIVNIFGMMKDELYYLKNSNEAQMAKEKGKEYFINAVDFIFYGGTINGTKFSDLTDLFKEEVYDSLVGMDQVISYYEPDYKEKLGEKYNAVKDFSKEKLGQAKELIINKIGQEKYDKIIEEKNDIVNGFTKIFKKYGGKALTFIKDKYENWRDK